MKTGFAFLLVLAMPFGVQAAETNWLTNYGDALTLARTTARPLLMVISHDELVPAFGQRGSSGEAVEPSQNLLDAYVLCQIDANSLYGKRVAAAYRVTRFPHSVIIDRTTTKVLYSRAGHAGDNDLKAALHQSPRAPAVRATSETQSQRTFWSQPRASGAMYNFWRSPVCNT